jgi:hypothetical protein
MLGPHSREKQARLLRRLISTSATIATTAPERWAWAMPCPTSVAPVRSGCGEGRGSQAARSTAALTTAMSRGSFR